LTALSDHNEHLWQLLQVSPDKFSDKELFSQLVDAINYLLDKDFATLIQLLYRVDVSEQQLRQQLIQHPQSNASEIIVELLVQRMLQKQETRKMLRQREEDISEDEKW